MWDALIRLTASVASQMTKMHGGCTLGSMPRHLAAVCCAARPEGCARIQLNQDINVRKSATKCCHAPPGSPRTPPSVADADDWSGEEKGADGEGLLESKQQTVLWDVCKQNLDIIYGLLLQRLTVVKVL